jgi:glyoxylase-like metal-dependent hydrolase (beta-lactamase superfamily II)/rhodanese-related sulfurtransferase
VHIEELNNSNCKTYLLVSGTSAALVDPVRERFETYRMVLAARSLELRMILETHMHADHLMMNRAAKDALGTMVVMHRESPSPLVDRHVVDGDVLELGTETIRVLHTPGHTPDSVCYLTGDAVLTGDTLLIGGSGRTDFPGGSAGAQYDGVTKKLFTLPDATVVWPAHDYKGKKSSTIGDEKRHNPRFAGKTREEYIYIMDHLGLPFPDNIQKALQVNQSGFEECEVVFPQVAQIAALHEMTPKDVAALLESGSHPLVLDVREPEEFTGDIGHIAGSLLVPLDALERRLPKLAGYVDRDVVVICRAGARSATAAAILCRAGFHKVKNLSGGMLAWVAEGLPVQH